jgi:hypothetical protein
MSSSATAHEIDSEIRDLKGDILGGGQPLLTYLRYDVRFDDAWLKDKLVEIGKAAAARIENTHFGQGFDITEPPIALSRRYP